MSNLHCQGVTLASALVLSAIAPQLYAQAPRIAVVDLQRALLETEDGRRAKAQLKRMFEKHQRELDGQQDALKRQKEQLEELVETKAPRPVIERRVAEYQRALGELQTKYAEYQRELAEQEARLTRRILERMQRILRRMGQEEGDWIILERNEGGVVWVPTNLDLTDQVIQRYNAGEGREGESAEDAPRGASKTKRRAPASEQ